MICQAQASGWLEMAVESAWKPTFSLVKRLPLRLTCSHGTPANGAMPRGSFVGEMCICRPLVASSKAAPTHMPILRPSPVLHSSACPLGTPTIVGAKAWTSSSSSEMSPVHRMTPMEGHTLT